MKATEIQGGLDRRQFVDFLSSVLMLPAERLVVLFQKMDANDDGNLSWDEYISYLLKVSEAVNSIQ